MFLVSLSKLVCDSKVINAGIRNVSTGFLFLFTFQYGPGNQRQLHDACYVVNILEPKVKRDLLSWFVKLQLNEYGLLFAEDQEVSFVNIKFLVFFYLFFFYITFAQKGKTNCAF